MTQPDNKAYPQSHTQIYITKIFLRFLSPSFQPIESIKRFTRFPSLYRWILTRSRANRIRIESDKKLTPLFLATVVQALRSSTHLGHRLHSLGEGQTILSPLSLFFSVLFLFCPPTVRVRIVVCLPLGKRPNLGCLNPAVSFFSLFIFFSPQGVREKCREFFFLPRECSCWSMLSAPVRKFQEHQRTRVYKREIKVKKGLRVGNRGVRENP